MTAQQLNNAYTYTKYTVYDCVVMVLINLGKDGNMYSTKGKQQPPATYPAYKAGIVKDFCFTKAAYGSRLSWRSIGGRRVLPSERN